MGKKIDYKKHIWKTGWVNGDKRWLFHAHGIGVGLDGKMHAEDGNAFDWDISDDRLVIGEKNYIILSLKTYPQGTMVIKDEDGNIETFIGH